MLGLEVVKKRVKEAPQSSGVYLFKNKKDIPIYIGKAINIKRRLSNYGNLPKLPRRLQKMVSQTCLLYTSPSPRDKRQSRMPSSA